MLARFDVTGSSTTARHRRNGRLVQHVVHAGNGLRGKRQIGEIAFEELGGLDDVEVGALAGDEAVGDADAVPAPQQFLREVRADEAGAAGDEIRVGHLRWETCPCGRPGMIFIAFW